MDEDARRQLAGWLAEAFTMGNPLAALPAALTPPDLDTGTEVAGLVLAELGLPACGLRLLPGPPPLAGPLIEGRLLASGTPIALATLRHARAAPAVLACLAAPLDPGSEEPAAIARLHPALDISASRFTAPAAAPAIRAADLAELGLVAVGRGQPRATGATAVTLRRKGRRGRPQPVDIGAALAAAAAEARAAGGLPAGALLLAVLGPGIEPEAGETLVADFGPLGRASAGFA